MIIMKKMMMMMMTLMMGKSGRDRFEPDCFPLTVNWVEFN